MIARYWKWIAATLLVAAAVHVATVLLLQRLTMLRTVAGISKLTAANTIFHAPRSNSGSRGVVRPSPLISDESRMAEIDTAGNLPPAGPITAQNEALPERDRAGLQTRSGVGPACMLNSPLT